MNPQRVRTVRDVSSNEVQRGRKEVKEAGQDQEEKDWVLMMETINIIFLLMVSVISVKY